MVCRWHPTSASALAGGMWLVLSLLLSCRCGPPEAPSVVLPHFGEWEGLVRAAVRADSAGAAVIARDLTEGQVGAPDAPGGDDGISAVGAALGCLQLPGDSDDLVDGVVEAAVGCRTCQAGASLAAPGAPPPWSHYTAAQRAVWVVVFADVQALGAGEVPEEVMAAVVASRDVESQAASVLRACQGCHAN